MLWFYSFILDFLQKFPHYATGPNIILVFILLVSFTTSSAKIYPVSSFHKQGTPEWHPVNLSKIPQGKSVFNYLQIYRVVSSLNTPLKPWSLTGLTGAGKLLTPEHLERWWLGMHLQAASQSLLGLDYLHLTYSNEVTIKEYKYRQVQHFAWWCS